MSDEDQPSSLYEAVRQRVLKDAWEREKLRASRSQTLGLIVAAILATGIGVVTAVGSRFISRPSADAQRYQDNIDRNTISILNRLTQDDIALKARLDALSKPPAGSAQASEIARLDAALQAQTKRQDRIEGALMQTPEKALEIPLLRRDVEALKASETQAVTTMQASVDRIYDLNKWLFGGIALSILAMVLPNLANTILRRTPKADA